MIVGTSRVYLPPASSVCGDREAVGDEELGDAHAHVPDGEDADLGECLRSHSVLSIARNPATLFCEKLVLLSDVVSSNRTLYFGVFSSKEAAQ